MDTLVYKGKLKRYLDAPLYMILLFILASVALGFYEFRLGIISAFCVVVYSIVIYWLYHINKKKLEEELINFATRYATVQKELLEHFQVPYALIDDAGKLLWVNLSFGKLTGKDKNYHKSITSIFREITKESISAAKEDELTYRISYGDNVYIALLNRLHVENEDQDNQMVGMATADRAPLISVMLLDETELEEYKRVNREQKLVTGWIYIDNYEETFESVEDVKRSLLTAVVERKLTKYFEKTDAILRKIEKDKYMIFFPNKHLPMLEEDRFSILEDIKGTKAGNDNEVTISVGLGLNGSTYAKCADYARTAIGLAQGRGGSQVVIKDREEVSYYGMRGKEIEKNTRVKARVKAQALRELMVNAENILVMGHQISDADALGAAIGVFCAARHLKKECRIVLNTVTSSIRPFVDMFLDNEMYEPDMFVESYQAMDFWEKETLLIVVDTNRPSSTECPELLKKSGRIVVLDHHRLGKEQISNPTLSYIEPYASSTCEMIAEILQYFSDKVRIEPFEADCIYAGILIDTNNFMTKTGVRTFEAAAFLRRSGSEVTRVRKMLREDMRAYKARAEIVRRAEVYRGAFALSIFRSKDVDSPTVIGAQASNELLNIVGIKASFVLTSYQSKIYVSARSIDEIDVQRIMERLGGGGHLNVAGAQIENVTEEEVMRRIERTIDVMIDEGEIKL